MKMNTAEYLIKKLEELGITDIFGVPGDYNFNILRVIENNPSVKWIGCTNELNAGYASDGYARVKGYGALVTTQGAGELSAINAVAGSFAENIPVVCITGLPSSKNIEKKAPLHHNFLEADYECFHSMYKKITCASAFLKRDNAKLEIDRVLKTLIKEKKPIYIAIPSDVALMEISDRNTDYSFISNKDTLKEAAEKISKKINKSDKPVILGDILVKRFDALTEYREFTAKSGIPVTNLLMGANLISADYEKYLGGYFSSFKNPIAQKYVEDTDCLISVGVMYNDLNSLGLNLPLNINNHIAIYGTYTYIEGQRFDNISMSDVLNAVTPLLRDRDISVEKPNIGYKPVSSDSSNLTSEYIYPRLQEFFKEKDVIICETGLLPYGMAQAKLPASADLQMQLIWASIGWATPASLGANIARPQSRVILITGEGAHQMTALEIGTILRHELKPIIIVLNNNGYTTERLLSGNPDEKFNNIMQMNYAKFARTFQGDIWATKVNTADDFDKALKVTQIMNKMCYIEICTEQTDAPDLITDLAKSVQETEAAFYTEENFSEDIKQQNQEFNDTDKDCSFEYETIVHKKIEA